MARSPVTAGSPVRRNRRQGLQSRRVVDDPCPGDAPGAAAESGAVRGPQR